MTFQEWAASTGLRQVQIAKLLGITQPAVCELLKGKRNFSRNAAMVLLKVSAGKVSLQESLFNKKEQLVAKDAE